nr:helix-turn-helix transcriptional regulator [Bacillus cereus]
MAIIINIDVMLAKRKMSVTELSEKVGITMANLSILKNGKAKAVRFSTLEAICKALECQPGDIFRISTRRKRIKRVLHTRRTLFIAHYGAKLI